MLYEMYSHPAYLSPIYTLNNLPDIQSIYVRNVWDDLKFWLKKSANQDFIQVYFLQHL